MHGSSGNQQKWRDRAIWTGILLLPPILINVYFLLPGAFQVSQTGICPSPLLDRQAYPCSPVDYLISMTLAPWSLPMQLLLLFGWMGVVVPIGAGIYFGVKRLVR